MAGARDEYIRRSASDERDSARVAALGVEPDMLEIRIECRDLARVHDRTYMSVRANEQPVLARQAICRRDFPAFIDQIATFSEGMDVQARPVQAAWGATTAR